MEVVLDIGGEGQFTQRTNASSKPRHPVWGEALWLTVNIEPGGNPDILADGVGLANINDDVADGIYSSHMIEHVPPDQAQPMFENWFRILKPGGRVEIRCPDVEWAWREYFAGRLPEELLTEIMVGIRVGPYEVHRNMWWPSKLIAELSAVGFVFARSIDFGYQLPYLDHWLYDGKYAKYHGHQINDLLVEAFRPPVETMPPASYRSEALSRDPAEAQGFSAKIVRRATWKTEKVRNAYALRQQRKAAETILAQICLPGRSS